MQVFYGLYGYGDTHAVGFESVQGQGNYIPEPASLAVWGLLGGLGLAGAWWRQRRRRKAA
jgi:MYXO-CTERM domain-containing protein